MIKRSAVLAQKFSRFLGPRVFRLFLVSLLLGLSLFMVESSFIMVLQGFLSSIGLIERTKTILPDWYPSTLTTSLAALIAFGFARGIVYMTRYYICGLTSQAFVRDQRLKLFSFGIHRLDQIPPHEMITVFNDRIAQAGGVLQQVSNLILVGTSVSLFYLLGLKLAPKEMLIGTTVILFAFFPMKYLESRMKDVGQGVVNESSRVNLLLTQALKNHFFFRIYGLLNRQKVEMARALEQFEIFYRAHYRITAFKSFFPNFIGILLISAITFISISVFETPGLTLISFFYIFVRFTQGLSDASISFSEFRLQYPGLKEIYEWHKRIELSTQTQIPTLAPIDLEPSFFAEGISIETNHLCFSFDQIHSLFENLEFKVTPGEVLLIKGESGAGKSTLLMIILGMLLPTRGKVRINGVEPNRLPNYFFENIAYIGPEPYIISGTVRQNLLFGIPKPENLSDTDLLNSLIQVGLDHERINLDLFVNEFSQLSTGQKQRISIARALIRKPSLMLLDEATANLDLATEGKLIEQLTPVLKSMTTVIISHKSTFDSIATQILELKAPPRKSS